MSFTPKSNYQTRPAQGNIRPRKAPNALGVTKGFVGGITKFMESNTGKALLTAAENIPFVGPVVKVMRNLIPGVDAVMSDVNKELVELGAPDNYRFYDRQEPVYYPNQYMSDYSGRGHVNEGKYINPEQNRGYYGNYTGPERFNGLNNGQREFDRTLQQNQNLGGQYPPPPNWRGYMTDDRRDQLNQDYYSNINQFNSSRPAQPPPPIPSRVNRPDIQDATNRLRNFSQVNNSTYLGGNTYSTSMYNSIPGQSNLQPMMY
jgi:hypothetical protein